MKAVKTVTEFRFDTAEELVRFLEWPGTWAELEHNVAVYGVRLDSDGNLLVSLKQDENGMPVDECECEEERWDDGVFSVTECRGFEEKAV